MGTPDDQPTAGPRLVEVQIADDPSAWTAAGFTVAADVTWIGPVAFRLTGRTVDGPQGITGWTVAGLTFDDGTLDGLATKAVALDGEHALTPVEPVRHPNGVIGLDHIVVLTPDLDRTIAACEAAGLDLRRIRETTGRGSPMRQAFFKLGPVVLEVVSGDVGTGIPADEAPATFFGLAVDVDDLDQTAAILGDGLGAPKAAVQRGRRIATLRHRGFDLSVAIAAMDHRGPQVPSPRPEGGATSDTTPPGTARDDGGR